MRPLMLPERVTTGPVVSINREVDPVVLPGALALLRITDVYKARKFIAGLPAAVLPRLADYAASRPTIIEPEIARELLRACGYRALARHVGAARAESLMLAHELPAPVPNRLPE
jgi:hypothetical protein